MCREPEEDDSAPWKEQENWEGDQIRRALVKAGTKDRKPVAEQYEYVFENQIDFITDAAARGEMVSSSSGQSAPKIANPCSSWVEDVLRILALYTQCFETLTPEE